MAGSRFEFENHCSKNFELFNLDCFATDDSVMTLALGKAVMEWKKSKGTKPLDELAVKYMREIGQNNPNAGYGRLFRQWLFGDDPRPYNSYGNGAAMRVSPCGLIAGSEEEAKMMSRAVTEVTHNHPEGLKGAESLTIAIDMAKNGASKEDIKKRIEADYYPSILP